MRRSPIALLLLIGFVLVASCGDDGRPARRKTEPCAEGIPFRAGYLPKGFNDELAKGPGGGKDPVRGAVAFHHEGPDGAYIDIFRGGQRQKIEKSVGARMLDRFGRVGKIDGGFAARIRLGRGKCTRYQIEAYKVSDKEFAKVLTGLRKGAAPRGTDPRTSPAGSPAVSPAASPAASPPASPAG